MSEVLKFVKELSHNVCLIPNSITCDAEEVFSM